MFRLSSNTPEPANQALLVYYRCFRTSHSRWKDYAGRELRVCGSLTLTLMEQDALKDIVCTWKGPTLLQMTFWLTARYIETEDLLSVLQRVLALSVIREKLAQVSNSGSVCGVGRSVPFCLWSGHENLCQTPLGICITSCCT